MKLKYFSTGLGLGTLLGTGISFLKDQKTGKPIRTEVKDFVIEDLKDGLNIQKNIQNIKATLSTLKTTDLPAAKKDLASINRSIKVFEMTAKPKVQVLKENIEKLNKEVK
ncbi:hypothetical protein [Lactobacillus sp. PV012]|uniref:hypothetical protein n=1 Tax=Lactobacillus sp. PV012 TaxID=2594494 RepID=UPI00223F1001|nr:hypothetical protein [Lactobacillus sp. PV012]QNQ81961.1 hypothetical protein FP433_02420 [Lactobacillus sp. PV012]